jgi:hypothetical protein
MEIRRAFTVFQLMIILEEARHSLILIEHDPLLYGRRGADRVCPQAMRGAVKEEVLFCSSGTDPFLEDLARNADRAFYFDEGPRAIMRLI